MKSLKPMKAELLASLFHRHVRQPEPLLKKVNAQHHLGTERRAASLLARRVRLDQREQLLPWHHALHLVQELALAGLAAGQVKAKVSLFHRHIVLAASSPCQRQLGLFEHHP